MRVWLALEILGLWVALASVAGVLYSVIALGGWGSFWHEVREVYAPSNVSEHGDLSEGR